MRLPCAKPPTAAQSSHYTTHNIPELTTINRELTK